MDNEIPKAAPDFLDLLVQAIADRVKKIIINDLNEHIKTEVRSINADDISDLDDHIDQRVNNGFDRGDITIDVEDIKGLERWFENSIESSLEELQRNGELKVDADSVEGLEDYIKETVKAATVSIDF